MKKSLALLVLLSLMLTNVSCGEKDFTANNDTNYTTTSTYETTVSTDSSYTTSSGGGGFNFSISSMDFIDIEEATVNSTEFGNFTQEFKLEFDGILEPNDEARIGDFTEEYLISIREMKADLLNKLKITFGDFDIKIDQYGKVSLDSSILFGGDSAVLSDEGKEFLKEFINIYTSVVFSEEYDGFISKIIVEGHTAPIDGSTYESGMPLSVERADVVKKYCLSSETGISDEYITKLSSMLESKGLSNSEPVKNFLGQVDMAASRRVTFKFLINLD